MLIGIGGAGLLGAVGCSRLEPSSDVEDASVTHPRDSSAENVAIADSTDASVGTIVDSMPDDENGNAMADALGEDAQRRDVNEPRDAEFHDASDAT